MKDPFNLWCASFGLTFTLTVLTAMFLKAFTPGGNGPNVLFQPENWVDAIVTNLYSMVITQSVVTMLQNRGIASPIKEKRKTRQYGINNGWTTTLSVCLTFYIFGYIFFYCSSFPYRNLALYATSGLVEAAGLASVLQLASEQDKIRQAIERESRGEQESQDERAQRVQEADRDLGGNDTPPAQLAPPENSAGREGPLPKDGAAV